MSVGDWLGLDETLRGPWSEDRPKVVGDDELVDVLGTRPAGLRSKLERSRYLERHQTGRGWFAARHCSTSLSSSKTPYRRRLTGQATDLLRRRLARVVDDLIVLFAGTNRHRSRRMGLNGGSGSVPPCSSPYCARGSRDHPRPRGRTRLAGFSRQGQLLSGATLREVGHDVDADYPPNRGIQPPATTRSSAASPVNRECFGLVG